MVTQSPQYSSSYPCGTLQHMWNPPTSYILQQQRYLRHRMNDHCFDTNHKDPDKPLPIHAGTHNQDFQTCYTTKILRAFPKQCNSSQLRQWELAQQWITTRPQQKIFSPNTPFLERRLEHPSVKQVWPPSCCRTWRPDAEKRVKHRLDYGSMARGRSWPLRFCCCQFQKRVDYGSMKRVKYRLDYGSMARRFVDKNKHED
uniref:Uncharacterized protein n=1 Tax=Timema poppense TaxID=170557 RepID=A0A7R9CJE4_TIMPO|nr:unnamed protein product [Timema poppensis]